jgi:hypothetical protein
MLAGTPLFGRALPLADQARTAGLEGFLLRNFPVPRASSFLSTANVSNCSYFPRNALSAKFAIPWLPGLKDSAERALPQYFSSWRERKRQPFFGCHGSNFLGIVPGVGRDSLWLNRRLARLLDLSDTPEPPSTTAKPYQQNFRQTVQKNTVLVFVESRHRPRHRPLQL